MIFSNTDIEDFKHVNYDLKSLAKTVKILKFLAVSSNSHLRSIVVPIQLDERCSGRGEEYVLFIVAFPSESAFAPGWTYSEKTREETYYYHCRLAVTVVVVVVDRPMISCHLMGVVFPTVKRIQKQVFPTSSGSSVFTTPENRRTLSHVKPLSFRQIAINLFRVCN